MTENEYRLVIDNPVKHFDFYAPRKRTEKRYYLSAQIFYQSVHFAIRSKIVKRVKWWLHNYLRNTPTFTEIDTLTLIFRDKSTRWDLDNREYFWKKVILDYLKEHNKIEDDSVKYVKGFCTRFEKGEPRLEIVIRGTLLTKQ